MIGREEIHRQYSEYIESVIANKDGVHGKLEVAKVERHLSDLDRTDIFFDEAAGDRVIKFASGLRLSDEEHWRQKIKLYPHQIFYFRTLFGWKKEDPDTKKIKRRFRRSLNCKPRKNGKSQENAIKTGYMFAGSGERGALCVTAANTREQALITYDETYNMLEHLQKDSAKAKELIKLMANACYIPSKKNVLKAMAADSKKLDGFKPSFASIDEVHEMKTNKIIKIFERGMAQKTEPLIAISTTVGYNTTYPFFSYYRMCQRILEGVLDDDSVFIDIYAMDEDDDWNDPKNWAKANPMLGKIINRDNFTQDQKSSRNEGGSSEIDFKVKNLNKWCGTAKTWLSADIIKASNLGYKIELREKCHLGVDLATVSDIAAVSCVFPPTETIPVFRHKTFYFIPEETIKQRTDADGVPYVQWANDGLFIITPGNIIDQTFIENFVIEKLCVMYDVQSIDIDRWQAVQFAGNLSNAGLEVSFYGQGFGSMNEPCKLLEKLFRSNRIDNNSDIIFQWMMSNVAIARDAAGNMKPDKANSADKIDGVSALLTGLGGYLKSIEEDEKSRYLKSGIRRL